MAYVTVRHLPQNEFGTMNCKFNDEDRYNFAQECLNNNNYIRVADLVLSGYPDDICNEAYHLTNSIDNAWYENPDIQISESASKGCRSTSIGDIIQIAGITYLVQSVGFQEMI
ncbi:MAG: hypothetical protein KAI79_01160 [Bacteroidales bacterium]|nr:hypothetical protein [Bacteroidales bacterium]